MIHFPVMLSSSHLAQKHKSISARRRQSSFIITKLTILLPMPVMVCCVFFINFGEHLGIHRGSQRKEGPPLKSDIIKGNYYGSDLFPITACG